MINYICPECGGGMTKTTLASYPPVYEAKCKDCGAVYQQRTKIEKVPLPDGYERLRIDRPTK